VGKILFCPDCGSTEIYYEIGGITGTYHCHKCDYIGPFVIEDEFEENDLPSRNNDQVEKRKRTGFFKRNRS
jgi:transcription initiation factor TFIIIB Brf1 subunit/transcription initiation factor TFIIB